QAGFVGTCRLASAGSAGGPSCGNYVCDGASASCPSTCATDSNCAGSAYCDATAHCTARSAQGTACTINNQCTTGLCVDGYCCDGVCSGGCDRCNVAGSLGTCSAVGSGGGANPACGNYLCGATSTACPGTCTSDASCASGFYCGGGDGFADLVVADFL